MPVQGGALLSAVVLAVMLWSGTQIAHGVKFIYSHTIARVIHHRAK